MSTLTRSNGIVLRHLRHGESSLILTVLMRDYGKVGVMAKGVRAAKRLGTLSALELFSEAQFVYYRKQGRDLQMLKEASVISPHLPLRRNLDLIAVASATVELLSRCLSDEDPHKGLYDAASETLGALDHQPVSPLPVFWRFEMDLFQSLGFELQLIRCAATQQLLAPPFRSAIRYRLADGSFLHPEAPASAPRDGELLPESFGVLSRVSDSSREFAGRIVVSARAVQDLQSFFARYLETHLPVRGHVKSLDALRWNDIDHLAPSS